MAYTIRPLPHTEWPQGLHHIPDPPKTLRITGSLPPPETKLLCVVGSRKYTPYGKQVTEMLIEGLRGYPISIVSGLALGIDSIAHKSALKHKLHTIAVPGSGLSEKNLYPRSHLRLAQDILHSGGALLSEFEDTFSATPWSFPQRNRIMAGISHAVLIIEAEEKSGTLITSRLATEYNRDVLVVPGNIFASHSKGPHILIKLGATPVTSSEDILRVLSLPLYEETPPLFDIEELTPDEKNIFEALKESLTRQELIERTDLPSHRVSVALSMLELRGAITESGGTIYRT